jgi:hypothetical protein
MQIGEEYKVAELHVTAMHWLRFFCQIQSIAHVHVAIDGHVSANELLSAAAPRLLLGQGQCGPGAWGAAHRHLPHVPVSINANMLLCMLSEQLEFPTAAPGALLAAVFHEDSLML